MVYKALFHAAMLTPHCLLLTEWLGRVLERGQQQQWPLMGQTRYSADLLESGILTDTLSLVSRLVRKRLTAVLRFGLCSVRVLVSFSLKSYVRTLPWGFGSYRLKISLAQYVSDMVCVSFWRGVFAVGVPETEWLKRVL